MIYELSEVQRAAVSHGAGPALVLAGPGSGKTTVITNRSVRLAGAIRSPERLLCVTFTRAAAAERRSFASVLTFLGAALLEVAFLASLKTDE